LPFGAPPRAPWKRHTVQPRTAGALHCLRVRFELAEHRGAFWKEYSHFMRMVPFFPRGPSPRASRGLLRACRRRRVSHYFFLGGIAIFVSEGACAVTFGFSFFGFPVAPNLTFSHRNFPLRRLAGCEHSIIRSAVVSLRSRPTRSNAGANNPTSTHLHDVFYYRNLFCS
jgi:hypothetical protein